MHDGKQPLQTTVPRECLVAVVGALQECVLELERLCDPRVNGEESSTVKRLVSEILCGGDTADLVVCFQRITEIVRVFHLCTLNLESTWKNAQSDPAGSPSVTARIESILCGGGRPDDLEEHLRELVGGVLEVGFDRAGEVRNKAISQLYEVLHDLDPNRHLMEAKGFSRNARVVEVLKAKHEEVRTRIRRAYTDELDKISHERQVI